MRRRLESFSHLTFLQIFFSITVQIVHKKAVRFREGRFPEYSYRAYTEFAKPRNRLQIARSDRSRLIRI